MSRRESNSKKPTNPAKISISRLIDALLDEDTPLNPRYLYRMSDLEGKELQAVQRVWLNVPLWRRQALFEDLPNLAESDYLLSFEGVGRLGLQDPDSLVRFGAIETLSACECETPDLIGIYLDLLTNDPDAKVRAVAATALAPFVFKTEMELLPDKTRKTLEGGLLQAYHTDPEEEVQRQAFESLGYSSSEEVGALIEAAYASAQAEWQGSALFAISRSANQAYQDKVLAKLNHPNPNVRLEAVRAAGELALNKAKPDLLELIKDDNDEVRKMALWSLSSIGGTGVKQLLKKLMEEAEEAGEEDEIQFLDGALENLEFNDGLQTFGMLDVDEREIENLADLWLDVEDEDSLDDEDDDYLEDEADDLDDDDLDDQDDAD